MYEKFLICLLLVLPYFIPVYSESSSPSETEYYEYYYDEGEANTYEWQSQSSSSEYGTSGGSSKGSSKVAQKSKGASAVRTVKTVEATEGNKGKAKPVEGTNSRSKTYSSTNRKPGGDGEPKRASDDYDQGDKGTKTKIVYKQEKETKVAPRDRSEKTDSKKSSGKWQEPAASYEEDDDEDKEPEKVIVERKDPEPKPKVVVKKDDKPERKVGLLESLACGGDRKKVSKCIPKLVERREEKPAFLSFRILKKIVSGAVDFTEFLACWAELKLCNIGAEIGSLFKTCVLDIPLWLQGKVDNCFYDIFCGSPNHCKDKYETCMKKSSGNERWENFKQCTAK